ncbi:hypothetical protein M6D81_14560, partial [Paenibacillus sp. J5C_2022]|uniref:hypothetical protein n=1 Tax=Paenibacillus sp. J5C2022 TaxID=2977129 RepID=UPI0021CFBBC6
IAFPSNAYDAGFASQTFKRGSFARCSVFKEQSLFFHPTAYLAAGIRIYHSLSNLGNPFFKKIISSVMKSSSCVVRGADTDIIPLFLVTTANPAIFHIGNLEQRIQNPFFC